MSKATLKKVLAGFNAEQLREIILDMYSARKEAKVYLDFFVDPDIDTLMENTRKALYKELNRVKKRALSPRWTVLRRTIKDVETLNISPEHVIELMQYTLHNAITDYADYYVSITYPSGMERFLETTIKYGDTHCVLDRVLPLLMTDISRLEKMKPVDRAHSAARMKNIIESYRPAMR